MTLPLLALDNSITIYDASGSTQTARPVTESRWFAIGDIPTCPQAYDGATPLTTQSDIKTSWSDGSVQHALVTFKTTITGNSTKTINFRNDSGATSCAGTGYLTYAQVQSALWEAQIDATANSITKEFNAKTILTALGSISTDPTSLGAVYWQRGALVTTVWIRSLDPAVRAGCDGFEWDFPNNNWKAAASNTTKTLCPQFLVSIYADTPTAGNIAVNVSYLLDSAWLDRLQTQVYVPVIKGGTSSLSTLFTGPTWRMLPRSAWWVDAWVSNAPGAIQVDHNLKYLIYSKALPTLDPTIAVNYSAITNELDTYWTSRVVANGGEPTFPLTTGAGAAYHWLWQKALGGSGGRKDIGLINGWFDFYLRSMGDTGISVANRAKMYTRFIEGMPKAYLSGPGTRYREHLTNRCGYRADGDSSGKLSASGTCTLNAQGLPMSIDARPTVYSRVINETERLFTNTAAEDRISYAACAEQLFASVSASPTFTLNSHTLIDNTKVKLRPSTYVGATSGLSQITPYFVVNSAANTIQLSLTQGGAAVNATVSQNVLIEPWDCQVPYGGSSGNSATSFWQYEDEGPFGHWNDPYYVPYLLTGHPFLLEAQQFDASLVMSARYPQVAGTTNARDLDKGYLIQHDMPRMHAWTLRNVAHAAFITPDANTAQKAYYTQKLKNNIALREGYSDFGTADGGIFEGDATRGAMWTRGKTTLMGGRANPLRWQDVRQPSGCFAAINEGMLWDTCGANTLWMEHYINIVHGHVAELFPSFGIGIGKSAAEANQLQATTATANYDPHMGAQFHMGTVLNTSTLHPTLDASAQALAKTCTLTTTMTAGSTTFSCNSNSWLNIQSGKYIQIDSEVIFSTGSINNTGGSGGVCPPAGTGLCTFNWLAANNVQRGARGTTPASHSIGATVTQLYDHYPTSMTDDVQGGYCHLWRAALSFEYLLGDSLPGWQWFAANPCGGPVQNAPLWQLSPRDEIRSLGESVGGTSAIITYTVPLSGACGKIRISTSPIAGTDSSDASDTAVSGSGSCSYNATSLSTGTQYYYRLSAAGAYGTARVYDTFTTSGAGQPLEILTESCPGGTQDVAYAGCTVLITGGTGPFTFSVSVGSLPSGLSLNTSSGAITGTPSGSGTSNFTIRVVDSAAGDQSQALSIAIAGVVSINTTTLPNSLTGQVYNQTITVSGGTPPYACTLDSGAVPVGTTLNSNCTLTGTTTDEETANFTVLATDSLGATDTQAYSIEVTSPDEMILEYTPSVMYPLHQVSFSSTPIRTAGTGPFVYTVAVGALPAGLSLDPDTGEISGTATAIGNFAATILVTDSLDTTAQQAITLIVYTQATAVSIIVSASSTSALLTFRLPKLDSGLTGTLKVRDSSDNLVHSSTIAEGPAVRTEMVTNLTPNTTYRAGIVFGTELATSGNRTFITAASASSGVTWTLTGGVPSTLSGVTHVCLAYGGTAAVSSTITAAVSAEAFSVGLTRDSGPLFYRLSYRSEDSCSTGLIATGAIEKTMVY